MDSDSHGTFSAGAGRHDLGYRLNLLHQGAYSIGIINQRDVKRIVSKINNCFEPQKIHEKTQLNCIYYFNNVNN